MNTSQKIFQTMSKLRNITLLLHPTFQQSNFQIFYTLRINSKHCGTLISPVRHKSKFQSSILSKFTTLLRKKPLKFNKLYAKYEWDQNCNNLFKIYHVTFLRILISPQKIFNSNFFQSWLNIWQWPLKVHNWVSY